MMRKITLLLTFLVTGILANLANAQHSFASVPGPTLVAEGSPVTLNINDAGNTASAPASSALSGTYSTFSVSVDWTNDAGNPWSNEADLTVITSSGSVLVNPPTTGGGSNGDPTTLTFDGEFTLPYDPLTDGALDIVLNQSFGGSSANWSNIVVTIFPSPDCFDPINISASNITIDSFDLLFTDGSGGNQLDYYYVVQPQGTGMPATYPAGTLEDGLNQISATDFSIPVSSLTPNTPYEIYIAADCNGNWVGPINFNTACLAFSVPFSEGFNSASSTEACWTVLNVNADGDAWNMNYALNPHEGDQSAIMYTDGNAGNNDDWLISPPITLNGGQRLKFHYRVQSTFEPNDFELLLSTTGTDASSFTNVLIPTTSYSNNTYVEQIVDLSAFSGDVNIAWHVPNGGLDGWRLYIDNVIVEDIPVTPPSCATNIVSTPDASCGNFNNSITWDVTPGADGYSLTIGTSTGANDVLDNQDLGNVTSYNFVGNANTTYFFTLVPYNANGPAIGCSEMSFTTFATGCYCIPTYVSSGASDQITNVAIGAWSNASSGNPAPSYVDYTTQQPATIPIPDLPAGTAVTVDVTMGTDGNQYSRVWIDFNQNLTFEPSESFSLGTNAGGSGTSSIVVTIPPGATLGQTRMRVRGGSDGAILDTQACGAATSNWGEAEDYLVNIVLASCTPPTVDSSTIVADCANSQYSVNVVISDLGDTTSATITDGTDSWPISVGTVPVGPFASGSAVTLTLLHDSDNTCDLPLGTFSYVCPPANDDCDNAIALTVNADLNCGVVTAGSNYGATASAQADDVTGTPNNDVWFSFVATGTNHVVSLLNVVAASGTSTDMGMGVYDATGGCMALTFVADSDPNSLTLTGLTIGNTYLVRVYNWGTTITNTDNFDICVGTPPSPPANDECDNAIALTVNADLSCGVVTSATNVSATASPQADDVTGTPNNDVWFSFVATGTSHVVSLLNVVAATGTSTDMGMGVYDATGGCMALTFVADSDPNTLTLNGLTIGNTYLVRVYNWGTNAANTDNFDICVGTPPAPPANDDCSNAFVVTMPYTFTQDASAATNNAGFISQCGGMNDGVWYTVVGDGGDITIDVTGVTGWDPEIGVYTGSCGAFVCVGNADDTGLGGSEQYTIIGSTIGETYYINVGYWSGFTNNPEGPFTIDVSTTLSTNTFNSNEFVAYPNPVKDVLTLEYSSDITDVNVINMLGQVVLTRTVNATSAQVDMSQLAAGTYLVNVTSGDVQKTIKVVKQ